MHFAKLSMQCHCACGRFGHIIKSFVYPCRIQESQATMMQSVMELVMLKIALWCYIR